MKSDLAQSMAEHLPESLAESLSQGKDTDLAIAVVISDSEFLKGKKTAKKKDGKFPSFLGLANKLRSCS